jgi:flagellar basal-body rod protein FlgC
MVNAISSALAGLQAASARFDGASRNIANAGDEGPLAPEAGDTPAYSRIDSVETTGPAGTPVVSYRPASPGTRPAYDPNSPSADANGLVAEPDVDLTHEIVDAIDAREAYKANLKTLEIANQMQRSLLEVLA